MSEDRSTQAVAPAPKRQVRVCQPIDDVRKGVFLKVLAETGSVAAAAQAATPWSETKHGSVASFRALVKRDPNFAAAFENARTAALGKLEKAIFKLASRGVRQPIYWQDKLVGYKRVYEPRVMLAATAKLDDEWVPKTRAEVTAKVAVAGAVAHLTVEDLQALPQEKRERLIELLEEVQEARDKRADGPSETGTEA